MSSPTLNETLLFRRWLSCGLQLHGATPQRAATFVLAALRTSNPTNLISQFHAESSCLWLRAP